MKYLLIISCFILLSCKKDKDSPMPKVSELSIALVYSIEVDNNIPIGDGIDLILRRDDRVDTIKEINSQGGSRYLAIKYPQVQTVSISSKNKINAILKVDDGKFISSNPIREYVGQNYITFNMVELSTK